MEMSDPAPPSHTLPPPRFAPGPSSLSSVGSPAFGGLPRPSLSAGSPLGQGQAAQQQQSWSAMSPVGSASGMNTLAGAAVAQSGAYPSAPSPSANANAMPLPESGSGSGTATKAKGKSKASGSGGGGGGSKSKKSDTGAGDKPKLSKSGKSGSKSKSGLAAGRTKPGSTAGSRAGSVGLVGPGGAARDRSVSRLSSLAPDGEDDGASSMMLDNEMDGSSLAGDLDGADSSRAASLPPLGAKRGKRRALPDGGGAAAEEEEEGEDGEEGEEGEEGEGEDGAELLEEDELSRQEAMDKARRENMRFLIDAMTPEQYDRHEAYRRGALNRANVRRLVNHVLSQSVTPNVGMVVGGVGKVFVGEIVEKARAIQSSRGQSGPLRPADLLEAHAQYRTERERPGNYPPGAGVGGAAGLGKRRRLF